MCHCKLQDELVVGLFLLEFSPDFDLSIYSQSKRPRSLFVTGGCIFVGDQVSYLPTCFYIQSFAGKAFSFSEFRRSIESVSRWSQMVHVVSLSVEAKIRASDT
jgi:hypothetical protein